MRVIETGYIEEETIICAKCASKIGYFPLDIKREISFDDYLSSFFNCPACGYKIILNKERYR